MTFKKFSRENSDGVADLQELSPATLKSYDRKAMTQIAPIGMKSSRAEKQRIRRIRSGKTLKGYTPKDQLSPEEKKLLRKRGRGGNLALAKLGMTFNKPRVMAKEETDLQELSPSTLKSYHRKAMTQIGPIGLKKGKAEKQLINRIRSGKSLKGYTPRDEPSPEERKLYNKRIRGGHQAMTKLEKSGSLREEDLQEISKKLLLRYSDKAQKEIQAGSDFQFGKTSREVGLTDDMKKKLNHHVKRMTDKRRKYHGLGHDKFWGKARVNATNTTEDTNLQELSKKTMWTYAMAAKDDSHSAREKMNRLEKLSKDENRTLLKRSRGLNYVAHKLTDIPKYGMKSFGRFGLGRSSVPEETNLQELSKKFLARYIGSASADKSGRAHDIGFQNALGVAQNRPRDDDFHKDQRKHRNRSTGIQRAAHKLAKEDTSYVDDTELQKRHKERKIRRILRIKNQQKDRLKEGLDEAISLDKVNKVHHGDHPGEKKFAKEYVKGNKGDFRSGGPVGNDEKHSENFWSEWEHKTHKRGFAGSGVSHYTHKKTGEKYTVKRIPNGKGFHGTDHHVFSGHRD